MLFLPSTLPGRPAGQGFSTRQGGVSEGRYAALNLGRNWGDDLARVDENLALLAGAAGFDAARLATCKQVHKADCVVADGQDGAALRAISADALVATEPGRTVGVYTADCMPILLSDGAGRVAAAHAGWRGTVAGIAAATFVALQQAGAEAGSIHVVLGPSIGPCCFEVGEEVAAEFERVAPRAVLREAGRKPHIDLGIANSDLLAAAGARHTTVVPLCTMCRADLFYSFRRDGAGIGQMLSFITAG